MILVFDIAYHTLILVEVIAASTAMLGLVGAQFRQLCLFTIAER